jgi:hypothetical protein
MQQDMQLILTAIARQRRAAPGPCIQSPRLGRQQQRIIEALATGQHSLEGLLHRLRARTQAERAAVLASLHALASRGVVRINGRHGRGSGSLDGAMVGLTVEE